MFFFLFFPFFLPEIQQSFKVLISQPLEHTLLKHDELLPAMITGAFFFFFFFFSFGATPLHLNLALIVLFQSINLKKWHRRKDFSSDEWWDIPIPT